jgi:hypothetical protein
MSTSGKPSGCRCVSRSTRASLDVTRHEFAAIMIMLGGILNVIWGIIALTSSRSFQASGYVVTDLHTWGWIVLFVGVLELVAAWSIWTGGEFGRYFGIVVAMLNAVSALVSIKAYPSWGICLFATDIPIIYALVTYGGGRSLAR